MEVKLSINSEKAREMIERIKVTPDDGPPSPEEIIEIAQLACESIKIEIVGVPGNV